MSCVGTWLSLVEHLVRDMKNYVANIVYFLLLFLFLCPGPALAWGPMTHLYLGNTLLAGAAVVVPPLISLLKRHYEHFLYGSLTADFFVGKGYRVNGGKYHNWETGMLIWSRTETAEEHAFAAGFLAHLAADTVAHGCFVPDLATYTLPDRIQHLYWEWLADCCVSRKEYHDFVKSACRCRRKHCCTYTKMDDFICEALLLDKNLYLSRKSLYLYPARIISSSRTSNGLGIRSGALPDKVFQSYALGSLNVMANVLTLHEDSPFLQMSPNSKHPKLIEN